MITAHRETSRGTAWRLLVVIGLMLSLAACASGDKKKKKEMNRSLAANRFQLGSRYLQDGEIRRSLSEFQESVRLEPRNAFYQNGLATAYYFLEEYELAEEHLEKALKINGAFSEAHHNLALVYSDLGRYEEAEEEYLAALEDPAYLTPEKVYLNWGKMLIRKGDLIGAESMIRKAVELNPRYSRGYQELGRLLEKMEQEDAALEAYLKAYAGLSEQPDLNLKLGEIYLRQGDPEQARRFLQKVLDTAPPESAEAMRAQAFLDDLKSG